MEKNFILYNNEAFKFTGVWQENGDGEIVSCHTSAQLEFGFKGNEIILKAYGFLLERTTFILDGYEFEPEISGEENVIVKTSDGIHKLKVILNRHTKFIFKGVLLLEKTELFRTKDNTYIQFIGDSITDAYPGFSSLVAKNLNVDYSTVSLCGISLVDKWGWYKLPEGAASRYGMESIYFKIQNPIEALSPMEYEFKNCRTPDAFVIFLGTNDYITSEKDKEKGNCDFFADRYYEFVKKIKERFGEKPFFIMQTHRNNDEIRKEAINQAFELIKSNTEKAYLLNCYEWDIELLSDGVHPSANGYNTMAEYVTSFIKEKINCEKSNK